MSQPGFLLAPGVGAGLWAGLALGAGWLLQDAVQAAIAALDPHAAPAAMVLLLLFAIWLGWKLWQKYRFRKFCAVPHVTPDELFAAMAMDQPPLLLDLRGATRIAETSPIIGARVSGDRDAFEPGAARRPKGRICFPPKPPRLRRSCRRTGSLPR